MAASLCSLSVHDVHSVRADPFCQQLAAIELVFGPGPDAPEFTVFFDRADTDLVRDLAEAINAVMAKHGRLVEAV